MAAAALLACDWGSTNLRAWTLDAGGKIVAQRNFPGLGGGQRYAGEAELRFREQVRPALDAGRLPAILCGMVGSNLGWMAAPYVDCPAAVSDLAGRLTRAGDDVWIVPGVRWEGFNGRGDVMRGEETQLFGWLSLHPEYVTGRWLVCHPGTHGKWMVVEDGRISAFATTMTGELFAVLSQHSVLRNGASVDDRSAFAEGVEAAGDGGALAARLFTARARVVGMGEAQESTSSYLSGLLVGADVAATPGLLGCSVETGVVLLGDAKLCDLYARALDQQGAPWTCFDGEAAAVAGLWALRPKGLAA